MSDETKKMERHTYIEGELFPEFAATSQGGGGVANQNVARA